MKLLSAQCTRAGQELGPSGHYEVPVDNDDSSLCWLDRGSAGPAVEALQRALVFCWFYQIEIDGDYGPDAQRAVRNMQSSLSIPADGVYGPQTRRHMGDGFAGAPFDSCAVPTGGT